MQKPGHPRKNLRSVGAGDVIVSNSLSNQRFMHNLRKLLVNWTTLPNLNIVPWLLQSSSSMICRVEIAMMKKSPKLNMDTIIRDPISG